MVHVAVVAVLQVMVQPQLQLRAVQVDLVVVVAAVVQQVALAAQESFTFSTREQL
jgi:hypothetical protein